MRAILIGAALALICANAGHAACTPPVPPTTEGKPEKPKLPEKPACLSAKDGCPGWEAYTYNDAIKAYNEQGKGYQAAAQAYIQKLNAYVKATSEYVQCEANSLR